jgi:hypothetical protein
MMERLAVLLRRTLNTGERLMSSRAIRLSAAFVLAGLAFGAAPIAPALADGLIARPVWHHPRPIVRHHVVRQVVYVPQYYAASSCGGCGSSVGYAAPQYYHASACGGCGSSSYIPYRHIVQPQYVAVRPQYYANPCGGCAAPAAYHHHHHGGYAISQHAPQYYSDADVQPARYSAGADEGEQEPVYVAPRRHRYHGYPTLRARY